MSKLAVKYNNDLNSIPLRNFTVSELNIFLTICASIKEQGTETISYDFDKIRELARYESTSVDRFVEDLQSTYDKLLSTSMKLTDGNIIEAFTLFNHYKIDQGLRTVEIQVNKNFKYILNDLNLGNFTRFELKEYTDINSTYSKALYMRLKQWKFTGKWEVTIDEFRRVMAVPKSYRMSDIDKQILKKGELDLLPFFKGLKIKKLDSKREPSGKGRPVKKLIFTFQKQDDSILSIQADKYPLGKYDNVWLNEKEHKLIKMEMRKGHLIELVSEWKHKRNNTNHNNDFALLMKFSDNENKPISDVAHQKKKDAIMQEIEKLQEE